MESDAFTGRGVEVQAIEHSDVHQIVGSKAAIALRFEIVGRVVTAHLTCRRQKLARVGVVVAVGKELKHEKRMGGTTLPEVDLDRNMAPGISVLHRYEIDAEPTEDAFAGKCFGDFGAARLDVQSVDTAGKRQPRKICLLVPPST